MSHRFTRDGFDKVVDRSSEVMLEIYNGVFPISERTDAYVITRGAIKIPFETPRDTLGNDGDLRVLRQTIRRFGEPGEVARYLGLKPVKFASAQEREVAALDAIEALLTISNSHYKKTQPLKGYCVVEWDGRIFRMEHFGIVWDDLGHD